MAILGSTSEFIVFGSTSGIGGSDTPEYTKKANERTATAHPPVSPIDSIFILGIEPSTAGDFLNNAKISVVKMPPTIFQKNLAR
ncbi:MAG: hypothetical protein IPN33_04445 [Saprospiraceae bacterium]|nr:hypothetical protein [Saprospiraceae bacterium]